MREKKNKNDNVNDVNGKRDNKKAAGKFKIGQQLLAWS